MINEPAISSKNIIDSKMKDQQEVTPFEILKTQVYPVINKIILKV
jgi:hypothetical protein